ncbi:MAG: hypothetical protein GF331_06620, partial [Chitinivibrionales bacterium]|nr:hypothetical protein [Chitinivibrionales bacterium]
MSRRITVAVAPTGGWGRGSNNPVTPEAIAADVAASAKAGASVLHLHSRDSNGELSRSREPFDMAVRLIDERCDIVLEASTGGLSDFTAQERVRPIDNPRAEMGSLNIGSLNFGDEVYRNSMVDVRYWIERMKDANVKPSLEVFDTGHLEAGLHLVDEGLVREPVYFSFIFGVKWGMAYSRQLLEYLIGRVPRGSRWGFTMVGSRDFGPHREAAALGASIVRTGFEDTREYNGKTAGSNAELVAQLCSELADDGLKLADPAHTRTVLG